MKKTIRKSKSKKDWFRVKKYPHIGLPLDAKSRIGIHSYINNPLKIAQHGFLPFIHRKSKVRKFRREICHDGTRSSLRKPSEKVRELYYSSHVDSNIYSFYSEIISKKYESKLVTAHLSECVTAYRRIPLDPSKIESRNKCNVDFANEVFSYIRDHPSANHLVAITFDIKSFFDTLDHKKLKKGWRFVMDFGADLTPDHYNVFRNITKFSYVEEREIFNFFKKKILVHREPSIIKEKNIDRRRYLRRQRAVAFCIESEINDLRKNGYIKSNKFVIDPAGKRQLRTKGIPQGSPISSVLANIYMFDFDTKVNDFIKGKGIYRRYSDDMVVICTPDIEENVIKYIGEVIELQKLELQTSKTQVFHFKRDNVSERFQCKQKNLNTGHLQVNTKFEYLGFQFDGFYTLLKSSSLSSFYRKMKRNIKRGFFYSRHNKTKTKGKLFKNRLYKRFTHLGAYRRRKYEKDKFHSGRFIFTQKYDWGNYLSYAFMAAKVIAHNKIRQQVKRHWVIFHKLIN